MRKFKITEEQMKYALQEGINIPSGQTVPLDKEVSNNPKAQNLVNQTKTEVSSKAGIKPEQVEVSLTAKNESKVITKKQIRENRMKVLKENSEIVSLKDFFKKN